MNCCPETEAKRDHAGRQDIEGASLVSSGSPDEGADVCFVAEDAVHYFVCGCE